MRQVGNRPECSINEKRPETKKQTIKFIKIICILIYESIKYNFAK